LKRHNVDLFRDGEWTNSLVIQFFQRPSCFDMLLLKPHLVSELDILLILTMDINIFFISSLCFFKVGYKLCLNVCQPHGLILNYKIHNVVHNLDVKLGVKIWFVNKKVCYVNECITLLYGNSTIDKKSNQLF